MEVVIYWILFAINLLLYGIACLLIIKRKNYTSISLRSPTLLLSCNLGNFLAVTVVLFSLIFNDGVISSFYYLFQIMMMVSFFLRCQRIIRCCEINKDERSDMQQFYNKRYLFQEKFYVKILLAVLVFFIILMIIIKLTKIDSLKFFYTYNLITKNSSSLNNLEILYSRQKIIWIIINFLEQFIMLTYTYKMLTKPVKQKIKLELLVFLLIWYIYSNISTSFDNSENSIIVDSNSDSNSYHTIMVILTLTAHYLCLVFNGYFPIILSYCDHTSISYHFSPKLMNNLYLFLTNEDCYQAFNNYLLKNKSSFYLKLYTHIMKYKLDFVLRRENGLEVATEIYNSYFSEENFASEISNEVLQKVRNNCRGLANNVYTAEMFDDALQFAFMELGKKFVEFRNNNKFKELYERLNLNSYIQCKLYNTGLINKF